MGKNISSPRFGVNMKRTKNETKTLKKESIALASGEYFVAKENMQP